MGVERIPRVGSSFFPGLSTDHRRRAGQGGHEQPRGQPGQGWEAAGRGGTGRGSPQS